MLNESNSQASNAAWHAPQVSCHRLATNYCKRLGKHGRDNSVNKINNKNRQPYECVAYAYIFILYRKIPFTSLLSFICSVCWMRQLYFGTLSSTMLHCIAVAYFFRLFFSWFWMDAEFDIFFPISMFECCSFYVWFNR